MKVYVVCLLEKYGEFINVLGVFSSENEKNDFVRAYKKSKDFDKDLEYIATKERTLDVPVDKLFGYGTNH